MKKTGEGLLTIVAAALAIAAPNGYASLVPATPGVIFDTGSGFGAVNTVLTLDNTKSGIASGGVAWDGDADDRYGPNTKPGSVHNNAWTFAQLDITDASAIRIILNAVEPGETDTNSITLSNLVLNIYSDAGLLLWDSGPFTSIAFPESETGVGKAGFVFMLDALQAAEAQGFITGTNHLGLFAEIANASGGPDTFFVLDGEPDDGGPPTDIPEPGSLALLGLGILAAGVLRRKTKHK